MKKITIVFFIGLYFSFCIWANPAELYQKGAEFQAQEDWYSAIEMYQSALQENPAYNLVYQGLAECFYALNEYDEALSSVQFAMTYKKNDSDLQNLHGFILIGLGKIEEARKQFSAVLQKFPNSPEARFGLAEIEIFQGKLYAASDMYKETLSRQGENRKALLSLALVSYEAGNNSMAEEYIKKALQFHGDNPQVHYFVAYLKALSGDMETAEGRLNSAIKLKENYDEAYALLSSVLYSQKRYEESIKISDIRIARRRNRSDAWYLKTLCLLKLDKIDEAMTSAKVGLSIEPDDEVMRALLEETAIKHLNFEDSFRKKLSEYHATRGIGFAKRNMSEHALFEYRRALKVYPYDVESRESYAQLLLRLGYPEKYLEQMLFIQTIVKSNTRVNDAVEAYGKHMLTSLKTKWKIDSLYMNKAHISIGLFYNMESTNVLHPDAEKITQTIISDIFSNNNNLKINSYSKNPTQYAKAFKTSRKAGEDYFGIIKLRENERDIQIILELYVSRTGAKAQTFTVYRSGNDRFSNASRSLVKLISSSLPIVGQVVKRYQNEAIIDIGKQDTDFTKTKIAVIKKDTLTIQKDGIAVNFQPENLIGYFEPTKSNEDLTEGILKRNGYYDRMNAGDSVILIPEEEAKKINEDFTSFSQKTSLLLSLLRRIR